MHTERGVSIHQDIPFYRQHYDFTCGPASLMMAMKYLDNDICLGKDVEIDLWREGNLVAACGTSRYGLAFSAAVRGFSARVTSNTGRIDFIERYVPPLNAAHMQIINDHFCERRTRCRKLGVRERQTTITHETVHNSLVSNRVPLIVTTALYFSNEDQPHWVAVTGIDDTFLYVHNPLDTHPRKRKIELPALQNFIGYRGDQSMVEIWKE